MNATAKNKSRTTYAAIVAARNAEGPSAETLLSLMLDEGDSIESVLVCLGRDKLNELLDIDSDAELDGGDIVDREARKIVIDLYARWKHVKAELFRSGPRVLSKD
jgi:hypothetical protein